MIPIDNFNNIPTEDIKAAILQFSDALDNFNEAWYALMNAWFDAALPVEFDYLGSENYPFKRSFDEEWAEVSTWVETMHDEIDEVLEGL